MKRWIWKDEAIVAHFLCPLMAVVFLYELLSGGQVWRSEDYILGILLAVVAYPTILWLVWGQSRMDDREQQLLLSLPAAEIRRRRSSARSRVMLLATLGGCVLVILGFFGVEAHGLPAHYVGLILLCLVALAICGVNTWYGGPLDPRHDPRKEPLEDS
jgi:hypothetical protein